MIRGNYKRLSVAASLMTFLILATACGSETRVSARPAEVPKGLVPQAIQAGNLNFYESTIPGVQEAFSDAGPESLVADGELWELRSGDRLVGTFQLTTLVPEVNLDQKKWREQILRRLIPTSTDRLLVSDVPVWTNSSQDRYLYLWFGRDIFALLILKGREEEINPEAVLDEVVAFVTSAGSWNPLFIEEELDE